MIWNLRRNDHDHAPRILTECFNYSRFESLSCIGRKPIMSEEALFTGSAGQSVAIESRSRSRLGLVVTGLVGGSLVALYAVATPFVAPALRKICLPFVPATTTQVENVLNALRARSGTLVDIGSGDGRIVIAAARHGFLASGFELNPWLVWYSRYKAWREGVHRSTSFHISDLWKGFLLPVRTGIMETAKLCPVSFAQYSNVVIFGVPQMMDKLELKLESELPSSAKVVACRFPFPNWVPEHTAGEGVDTVWVYNAESFKSLEHCGAVKKTTSENGDTAGSHLQREMK